MSNYFDLIRKSSRQNNGAASPPEFANHAMAAENLPGHTVTLPIAPSVIGTIARAEGVRRLTERVSLLTAVGAPIRLLVSGCRPGDGASSVASGIALDLSQRLGVRTLLIDGHFRHPTLRPLFSISTDRDNTDRDNTEAESPFTIFPTSWPHLDLATCRPPSANERPGSYFAELNNRISEYPFSVVDLGVVRLDSRILALARPEDPILLVVRYRHTERCDLNTTASALKNANRPISGVVFNARHSPVPSFLTRIFGLGGARDVV